MLLLIASLFGFLVSAAFIVNLKKGNKVFLVLFVFLYEAFRYNRYLPMCSFCAFPGLDLLLASIWIATILLN